MCMCVYVLIRFFLCECMQEFVFIMYISAYAFKYEFVNISNMRVKMFMYVVYECFNLFVTIREFLQMNVPRFAHIYI